MQDQRIEDERTEDRVSNQARDQAVLHLLLDGRWPWTVDEIARELDGNCLGAGDAIARLAGAGLVHCLGEFVFPTRTARRADEINLS